MNGDEGGGDSIDITLSRRKALAAVGTIGAASAGAGFGTSAFFSDQETFSNNSLVAGELDLKAAATSHYIDWIGDEADDGSMAASDDEADLVLEAGDQVGARDIKLEIGNANELATDSVQNTVNGGVEVNGSLCVGENDVGNAALVELDDVKPGDFGILRFAFESCTNPAFLWFQGVLNSASENGTTEPEADDPDEHAGTVELLDAIRVAAVDGDAASLLTNNEQDSSTDPTLTVAGDMSLREFLAGGPSIPLEGNISAPQGGGAEDARNCFTGETVHRYSFLWWLPVDHANEVQTDSVSFDLGLYAEQCRHNDGVLPQVELEFEDRYKSGIYDEGGAEIPTFDPASGNAYVINANAGLVDVLDLSANSPLSLTEAGELDPKSDLTDAGFGGFDDGSVNSVDAHDGLVAVAVENNDPQADGRVALYDTSDDSFAGSAPLGPLPDLVKFTPDGNTVMVANEGEPTSDYSEDPEGSVSVVDISNGAENASSATADFRGFDAASLRDEGVRIFGPNASAAEDLEPESVVAAPDSQTAYVTLQENNAIGVIDISDSSTPTVTDVVPLGYKNFSEPGNELDAVNDGQVDIRNEPLFGMYQPDVIETYEVGGETYIVAANEGDAREYDALFETGILTHTGGGDFVIAIDDDGNSATADVDVDESAFSSGVLSRLEGLEVTARPPSFGEDDVSNPGPVSELYLFGGRSYLILDSDGNQVFESGDQFEQIVRNSNEVPNDVGFNADDNENGIDEESPAAGPEPEGVAIGEVGGRTYAFIGFEEVGGVAMFDVTAPQAPGFVDYINTRDFSVDPETAIEDNGEPASVAGDLAPEGLTFVPAADSPTSDALLIVGYEVSGTTAVYSISAD